MRVLSLFSGCGLGDYGLELSKMEIVGQIEIDEKRRKILDLRWPLVPKWADIKGVSGKKIIEACGPVDLVAGGPPCQPHSVAGKRLGEKDNRNLWPEMSHLIFEVTPAYVLFENVSGSRGFVESVVLPDLESLGCETTPPILFEAHALGAPHHRERLWVIAYSHGRRCQRPRISVRSSRQDEAAAHVGGSCAPTTNTVSLGRFRRVARCGKKTTRWTYAETTGRYPWQAQPGICRVVNGRSGGMDRLKMLGNGWVVPVAKWLGEKIMEFDNQWATP